jgi:tetratricopeptide (TPR) repeat protein
MAFGLSAQNVKKGFKLLEKAEYEKSAEVFGEVIGENEQNLAAIFGMAMIYADNKSTLFNLIDAWSYAIKLRQNVEKLTPEEIEIIGEYFSNTEVRPRTIPVKKKIQYALETVEANLIKYIREENNLDIVYAVLEKFPDFRYRDNVIHIRNQLEFRKYEKQNTLEAYLEFIQKFPDASQLEKSIRYRNKLAFEKARQVNTVEAFQDYLKKYPEASECNMAVKMLNAVAFQQAKKENTITAYENFISAYPDALEVADAKQLLKELLYEDAKKIQTVEAYNEFIRKYPEGQQYIDIFNLKSLDNGMKLISSQAFPSNNVQWARSFGEEEATELTACMAIDSNDFYVAGGTVVRSDTGTSDAWVLKLGTDGKMLWNKFVGDAFNNEVNILDINNRNEIIGIGHTWLGRDSSSRESWIFKLGSDGQKLWSKKLGSFHVRCILTTGQGTIFLGGFAINDSSGSIHYAMMSLNEYGKRLWNRTYTGIGEIVSLSLTGDKRILVTGNHWRARMDPRGYLIWETSCAATDSILNSVALPRGETLYLGLRNRSTAMLIKTGPDNKVIYEKEITTPDTLCAAGSLIYGGPGQVIALLSFPGYQSLNWINVTKGEIQKTARIPAGMTLTGIRKDLQGNLMLAAYTGEILLIKNTGITF